MNCLLREDALSQRELGERLQLASSTVSRRMARLEQFGLARRDRVKGPYTLTMPRQTRSLLQSAADLNRDLTKAEAEAAEAMARSLRKSAMTNSLLFAVDRDVS